MSAPLIEARALTRRFGEAVAVRALDLDLAPGEILGLLGHNGAGKTTTVRLLAGVLARHGGALRVLGLDPGREGARLRRSLGVLTEEAALDPRLTPEETLAAHAEVHGLDRPRARAAAALDGLGLAEVARRPCAGLSRGVKRRVALARAMMTEAPLLLLDEPAAALDPVAARAVRDHIRRRVDRGAGALICTHDLAEAERSCDRVVVLERGCALVAGAPSALVAALPGAALALEVHPEDLARALDLLGEGVEVTGPGALRLEGRSRADTPETLARLVAAGVRVYALTPSRPGLAELYFDLHARGAR